MEGENYYKQQLLGLAKEIPKSDDLVINRDELFQGLENESSIIKCLCTGCGVIYELDEHAAEKLSEISETELPKDLKGKYFEIGGCSLCDTADAKVELKDAHNG